MRKSDEVPEGGGGPVKNIIAPVPATGYDERTMPEPTAPAVPQAPGPCPEHQRSAKWLCGQCGQPVCAACQPIAFDYKVFHPKCLEKLRQEPQRRSRQVWAGDAPSTGVKVVAWTFLVSAVLWLGLSLLALGVTFFAQHYLPLTGLTGGPMSALDEIPGGRALVGWVGVLGLAGASVLVLLGLGLLNCVPAARYVILIFSWAEIIVAVLGWLVVLLAQQGFWDIPIFALVLVAYFSRADVKKQFQPAGTPAPSPPKA